MTAFPSSVPSNNSSESEREIYEATTYGGALWRRLKTAYGWDHYDVAYTFHTHAEAQAIKDHYKANAANSFSVNIYETGSSVAKTAWYTGPVSVSMPKGYGTWVVSVKLKVQT